MLFKSVTLDIPDPVLPKQELRRRSFLPAPPSTELEELALKAVQVLGYGVLHQHIKAPGVLSQTLRELDITVLNEAEVERYKIYMARELTKKLSDPRREISWTEKSLSYYYEPIPEFVLRKAISIKQKLEGVRFDVDYLTAGFKSLDPFLIARYRANSGGHEEKYYIEVWDEPEFEFKL